MTGRHGSLSEEVELAAEFQRTGSKPCRSPIHCPCESRRWTCDRAPGAPSATSPRHCDQPHVTAAGWGEVDGSQSRYGPALMLMAMASHSLSSVRLQVMITGEAPGWVLAATY